MSEKEYLGYIETLIYNKKRTDDLSDLEYLDKMHTLSAFKKDITINDNDIANIEKALETNLNTGNENQALEYVSSIIASLCGKEDSEKLASLIDTVLGEAIPKIDNNPKTSPEYRTGVSIYRLTSDSLRTIAARLIDEEQYDKFKQLKSNSWFNKDDVFYDNYRYENRYKSLTAKVKTLKSLQFLEKENLLSKDYFTEFNSENEYPPLYNAYPEQIDFYIEHGAKVNETDINGHSILDSMLYASRPSESIDKICKAGGKINTNILDDLLQRVTDDYEYQREKYGERSIERTLKNILTLKDNKVKMPDYLIVELVTNKKLQKEYPNLIQEFMAKEDNLTVKDWFIRASIHEYNAQIQEEIDLETASVRNEYLVDQTRSNGIKRKKKQEITEEKMNEMKLKIDQIKQKKEEQFIYTDNDDAFYLEESKTAQPYTGEVNEKHKKVAELRTQGAKHFLKFKKQQSHR